MFNAQHSPDPNSSGDALPPERLRTAITFLIFVHLFALAMAVLGNFRPTSPLRTQLGEIPILRSYVDLLAMNTGYNFHFTYGLEEDTPQYLEIAPPADTAAESKGETLTFPPAGVAGGMRGSHYRNLMLDAYARLGDDDTESILPRSMANYLLRQNGVAAENTPLRRLRLRRWNLRSMADVGSPNPALHEPYADRLQQTAYEADVWYAVNQLQLMRAASALESATIRSQPDSQPPGN